MKLETVHLYVFDSLSDWEIGFAAAGINNPHPKCWMPGMASSKPVKPSISRYWCRR